MVRLKPQYFSAFLCYALGVLSVPACAQEKEPPTAEEIQSAENAALFSSRELLEITLQADFHTVRREDRSDEDSEERPAVMEWANEDGSVESQEIQVQTRGIFRLNRKNCDFPPLRINVKKGATKGTLFDGQDKLKLVGVCKLGKDYWEQYVLAEYLVYRMFNVVTPVSLRVRLAKITYVDTSGEDETFIRYGFLIEDDDALATRTGGLKLDWDPARDFHPASLEKKQAIAIDVFQYMIGNTDWSGVRMHNMEIIQILPSTFLTVPYDFDFSGIIDTRYARPDAKLPIRSVRQRLFRGVCPEQVGREPADYDAVYQEFREMKEELYDLWRQMPDLDEDRLKDTLEYLDDFFETMDDPEEIQDRLIDHCRRIGN
jgi:hypothetical protein